MSDLENKEKKTGVEPQIKEEEKGIIPFYPLHMMKEIMVMLCIFAALLLLAAFFPAHLQGPADPFNTPAHIKPEWYFLSVYQLLKYVPGREIFSGLSYASAAISLISLSSLFLFILPFVDFYQGKAARKRPFFLVLGLIVIIGSVVMIYLGMYSGGTDPLFHMHVR